MDEARSTVTITPELMQRIEDAAVSAAREILSGRRILDVNGPYGVGLTTVEVGNDDRCREPGSDEASPVVSRALSVPMIYRRFAISKRRIMAFQEMGQPLNLKVAEDAAQAVAAREEEFIYQGQADFHLGGLLTVEGSHHLEMGNWGNVDEVLDNIISAVFKQPRDVMERNDLSRDQKIEILRRWEYDVRELQVADDESMTAGEPPAITLDAVLNALGSLGSPVDVEHSAPTKQGGS